MNPPTDWTTPITILVAGLILGALFIFYFINRRKAAPVIEVDLERKDLEAKRDALIADLRALPDDAVDERARLEQETANVLRQLDSRSPLPAARGEGEGEAASSASASPGSMNPVVKGFLYGAGSFAALAGMLFLVYKMSTERQEGGPATGGTSMAQQQQPPAGAPDPSVQALEAAVQKDPNNSTLRLDLAQAYLERDNLMGVFEQTKVVLEREPQNARALTFGALVRMAMGEVDEATTMLQTATKVDSKNLDSWVALAWIYAQTNRMPDAEGAIAQAIRISPENRGRLEDVLAQMKQAQAQGGAPQQAQSELPEGHPPIGGAPAGMPATPPPPAVAAPPAGAAGGPSIKVTLQLDPAAKTRNGILYVMARPLTGGPPVAVKRIMAANFPMTFDFGAADSMMGQPLPDKFRLDARLDSDGDAATKPPTDPAASQPEVSAGAVVTLVLK
jgi:cytochrome c-type biogenesis protein CcmH/NrfG